ncbi:RES family NAD+ phosphorylase [Methylobacterium marchantiae]|uniref:RES family NAD+ phosphorylase n=1 Tax=Methylobacterium marchantiae TaxID=600331 RepID=A0ABW3WVV4_9HYPH|nr:hypothetical protein AIGOOFII_3678 [Methylobacterium marchantiae]
MNGTIKQLSKFELHQQIRKINRIDPRRGDYQYIKSAYEQIVQGFLINVVMSSGGELFFRARKNPRSKILHVDEMGAPPISTVTGFQRCNPPHIPMFYCASKRITAIIECRPNLGDQFYLGQWIGKGPVPINRVFDPWVIKGDEEISSTASEILTPHLDTIFTRRIHETFSDDYKFTAAIAQLLTANYDVAVDLDIREDKTVGLRYPSVMTFEDSYNTTMHVKFSKDRLELLHLMELKVVDFANEVPILTVSDTALEFDKGIVHWTGDKNLIPAFKSSRNEVLFRSNERRWLLETSNSPVSVDEFQQLLKE